ncbi:hypothetical protein [Spiroplasma endosymbiont of Clivina fossor]|uniref:tRNA (guanine(46)-N(7))-methyltransferase TrmB n=1 Tax=Spiroplasma endosymbiont of Clivina fossor TaxID=3066282 RepID=UPI00313CD8AD
MYKKVKVKIVILYKSLLKLSSWWFFLFYQEFSTKLKKIFNNTQPCHLEIGCGKGDFIIAMAHKYSMINFIAIEKSEVVLMAAVKKVVALEKIPTNLKFVQIDANNILNIFAINEITEIYLNFSDPWPKKKHYIKKVNAS